MLVSGTESMLFRELDYDLYKSHVVVVIIDMKKRAVVYYVVICVICVLLCVLLCPTILTVSPQRRSDLCY